MAATATNDNVADADVSSTSVLDDDVKTNLEDMAIGAIVVHCHGGGKIKVDYFVLLSLLNHFLQSQRPVSIQSV